MSDKIVIEVFDAPEERGVLEKDAIRVLSFALGKENYGVDVTQAKEVFRSEHFTRIPGTPDFVVGVTNLRGQIISIIDIRPFLGLPATRPSQEIWLIVTDVRGGLVGVMVDRINEAVRIHKSAIQPPVATISGAQASFTTGQIVQGSNILVMLDLAKIMSCTELENLRGTHG